MLETPGGVGATPGTRLWGMLAQPGTRAASFGARAECGTAGVATEGSMRGPERRP
jgi:hypothetical protein